MISYIHFSSQTIVSIAFSHPQVINEVFVQVSACINSVEYCSENCLSQGSCKSPVVRLCRETEVMGRRIQRQRRPVSVLLRSPDLKFKILCAVVIKKRISTGIELEVHHRRWRGVGRLSPHSETLSLWQTEEQFRPSEQKIR